MEGVPDPLWIAPNSHWERLVWLRHEIQPQLPRWAQWGVIFCFAGPFNHLKLLFQQYRGELQAQMGLRLWRRFSWVAEGVKKVLPFVAWQLSLHCLQKGVLETAPTLLKNGVTLFADELVKTAQSIDFTQESWFRIGLEANKTNNRWLRFKAGCAYTIWAIQLQMHGLLSNFFAKQASLCMLLIPAHKSLWAKEAIKQFARESALLTLVNFVGNLALQSREQAVRERTQFYTLLKGQIYQIAQEAQAQLADRLAPPLPAN